MQTNGLAVASGMPRLRFRRKCSESTVPQKVTRMSKTASLSFAPSATLFGRLMATIDRLLMASARIAIRNGDLPYFGL